MPTKTKQQKVPKPAMLAVLEVNLSSAADLVQAQVDAGLNRESAINALYGNMRHTMENMPSMGTIDHKERLALTNLCNKGPWSAEQKKELASLLSHDLNAEAPTLAAKNQRALHFENCLVQSDWITIRNKDHSRLLRQHTLALAAARVNLKNPCEMTLFRLTSILAWGEGNYDMSQSEVWKCMDQLQEFIKGASKAKKIATYLAEFPFSAKDLPDDLKESFNQDAPVDVTIPELN